MQKPPERLWLAKLNSPPGCYHPFYHISSKRVHAIVVLAPASYELPCNSGISGPKL